MKNLEKSIEGLKTSQYDPICILSLLRNGSIEQASVNLAIPVSCGTEERCTQH